MKNRRTLLFSMFIALSSLAFFRAGNGGVDYKKSDLQLGKVESSVINTKNTALKKSSSEHVDFIDETATSPLNFLVEPLQVRQRQVISSDMTTKSNKATEKLAGVPVDEMEKLKLNDYLMYSRLLLSDNIRINGSSDEELWAQTPDEARNLVKERILSNLATME